MVYWHIQVHPGDKKDWTIEDSMEVLKLNIIGCSGKPVTQFLKISPGDLLLVRYGKQVLALVRSLTIPTPTPESYKTKHFWFDWYSKIEILKTYESETISGKGWYLPTTLQKIKSPIALEYFENLLKSV